MRRANAPTSQSKVSLRRRLSIRAMISCRYLASEVNHPKPARSGARGRQPERGHLLAVAGQEEVAGQYRVVPGLALDRRESRELFELVRGRCDQRQLTVLREHQQQVLLRQQN